MSEIFKMVQEISKMQLAATKAKDSGWIKIPLPEKYKNRGITDHKRMLYLDHEPTETYIETLFTSAPFHNSRSVLLDKSEESGLWVLTLNVTLDSSD